MTAVELIIPQDFFKRALFNHRFYCRVRCYQFSDDTESTWIEELSQIMCFTVDSAEKYILIDTTLHGLRLWDLKTKMLTRTFTGALHKDFIIHSSFGGPGSSYVVTGSEGLPLFCIFFFHVFC